MKNILTHPCHCFQILSIAADFQLLCTEVHTHLRLKAIQYVQVRSKFTTFSMHLTLEAFHDNDWMKHTVVCTNNPMSQYKFVMLWLWPNYCPTSHQILHGKVNVHPCYGAVAQAHTSLCHPINTRRFEYTAFICPWETGAFRMYVGLTSNND
jgi:hypothetical protein